MKMRPVRRWGIPLASGAVLVASLTLAVRRSEEGRRLSTELDRLESEEGIFRDRLATEIARSDSLAALPRVEVVARELGLRRAGDGEVFHLTEPRPEGMPAGASVGTRDGGHR
ncbi:MAG: hypothetical protein R3195_12705 [Gemmatimonadota bacterium]|nr:hypothetical protein [Gemmatimonadota bacterium]